MHKVKYLRLNNNALETLDKETLSVKRGGQERRITLYGNPWMCDCKLAWLIKDIQAGRKDFQITGSKTGTICSGPPAFKGMPLSNVSISAMNC